MVAVTAVLVISSLNVVDGDSRNFFFVVAGALGGLQGALVWRRTHATVDGKERALGSTLAGIAGAPSWFVAFHVIASRAIVGLLAVAVIARAVFRVWRDTQDDKYFTWLETMRSTKVDRIRPWAVVWATVKNDNDEEATWGKIRPCIVLPPRETWRNHRPPSSAEYYGPDGNPVFSDGYPVLICTSQSKRADDPRYLEVHPFINSTQSDLRFTRSYVNLSRLYIVPYMSGTEGSMNSKSVEYQMLTSGNFDEFIVVESLGPLLNDADSERICGALEELGYF